MNEDFEKELSNLILKYRIHDNFDLDAYTLSKYLIEKLEDLKILMKQKNNKENKNREYWFEDRERW